MTKYWIAAAAVVGLSGFAAAQNAATVPVLADQVIAARQAAMDLEGGNLRLMKAAVDAKADVKPLASSAEAIAKWGRAMPGLFPDGTQHGHDTTANASVWSDRTGFEAAAAKLVEASDKLAQAARSDDKAAFAEQFAAVGQSCGACHRQYRTR